MTTDAMAALRLMCAFVLMTPVGSQRIWTVAIGNDWGGHEYYDDTGYLQGFGLGLIDLVCTTGNLDCRIMWDVYKHCWNSDSENIRPLGGIGLMDKWYDVCTGWTPTVDRIHTFDFTISYINQRHSFFYVYKGREDQFDPNDLTGKIVGFVDGFGSNEQCIARQTSIKGHVLSRAQIRHYPVAADLVEALRTGQVDVAFGTKDYWTTEQKKVVLTVDKELPCYVAGGGMMARKDSDFIAHWNTAFMKLKKDNKFNNYCKEANKQHEHKGVVDCITL